MKDLLSILLVVIVAGIGMLIGLNLTDTPQDFGYGGQSNIATYNVTSTVVSLGSINAVTTTDATTTVSTERLQYIEHCVASSTVEADVILQFGTSTNIKTGTGRIVGNGTCWAMYPSTFLYRGQIWALATTGNANASATISVIKYYSP